MKFAFSLIFLFHAIIHLIGFASAFKFIEVSVFSKSFSKTVGLLWLFSSLLLIISLVLFLIKKEWWFRVALIAVTVSQILIFMYWKDAKFGTIINIIIMLVSISAYGKYKFSTMVQKESVQIFQNLEAKNLSVISENEIKKLPEIVQKWMRNSGVLENEKVITASIKQKGKMRTKPNSKWMPFKATQYFNIENPAFIWTTEVDAMPIVKMIGRDKLYKGEGSMLIKLGSLIPVVDEREKEKINQGVMVRFLAEICWFPSAAINNYITWKKIDSTSAKAILTINDKYVSGIFRFSNHGDLVSFESERYYGGKNESKLEKWFVKMNSYKTFSTIKIPNKSTVIWKLQEGDFEWLDLEITDMKFNLN